MGGDWASFCLTVTSSRTTSHPSSQHQGQAPEVSSYVCERMWVVMAPFDLSLSLHLSPALRPRCHEHQSAIYSKGS